MTRLIQVSYALCRSRRLLGPFALHFYFNSQYLSQRLSFRRTRTTIIPATFRPARSIYHSPALYIDIVRSQSEKSERDTYDDELESKFEICEAVKLFSACHLSLFRDNLMRSVPIVLNSVAIPRQQKQRDTNCSRLAQIPTAAPQGN